MGFRRESAPLYAHWAGHWATGPLPTAHCPLPAARGPVCLCLQCMEARGRVEHCLRYTARFSFTC